MFSRSPHDGGGKQSHRGPTFSPNYQLDHLMRDGASPGTASPHLAADEDGHAADDSFHQGDSDEDGLLTQPPEIELHDVVHIPKCRRLSLTHAFNVGSTTPATTSPSSEQCRHHESSSSTNDGFLTQPPDLALPNSNIFQSSCERTPILPPP